MTPMRRAGSPQGSAPAVRGAGTDLAASTPVELEVATVGEESQSLLEVRAWVDVE
jgi:hypothetical protein